MIMHISYIVNFPSNWKMALNYVGQAVHESRSDPSPGACKTPPTPPPPSLVLKKLAESDHMYDMSDKQGKRVSN